jgi:hypothetical protein
MTWSRPLQLSTQKIFSDSFGFVTGAWSFRSTTVTVIINVTYITETGIQLWSNDNATLLLKKRKNYCSKWPVYNRLVPKVIKSSQVKVMTILKTEKFKVVTWLEFYPQKMTFGTSLVYNADNLIFQSDCQVPDIEKF